MIGVRVNDFLVASNKTFIPLALVGYQGRFPFRKKIRKFWCEFPGISQRKKLFHFVANFACVEVIKFLTS